MEARPELDAVQRLQEDEYAFPYHYLPQADADGAVRQFQYWGWGYRYLAGIDFVAELVGAAPFATLADVGCGDGRMRRELGRRFPEARLCGLDFSERAVALARALNPGLDLRVHDVTREPLGETFDTVVLSEVLEHIPPPELGAFVAGVAGLMHAGSRLVVTVPHANQKRHPKHYQHFTRASLEAALVPHVRPVAWHPFDRRSRGLALWQRVLRNRFWVLNHAPTLRRVARLHREHIHGATESDALRLAVVCRLG